MFAAPVDAQSGYDAQPCAVTSAIRCYMLVERRTEVDSPVYRASIIALWRASPHDVPDSASIDSIQAAGILAANTALRDSLHAAGRSLVGHGSIYGHAQFAFSRRAGGREILATLPDSAFLSGGAFRVPAQDSTLVLLVDGLERIDYQPTVTAIVYARGRLTRELEAWLATLRIDPRVAAFLERTP